MSPFRYGLLLPALAFLLALAAPSRASAEALVQACNESPAPVGLAMRIFGFTWEQETLASGDCRNLRISGVNLLFDVVTLWHGARLRLEPETGTNRGFCEWKIDFGAATWQRHAIRLEESAVVCVFHPSAEIGTPREKP